MSEPADGQWGALVKGKWTGMFGDLNKGVSTSLQADE